MIIEIRNRLNNEIIHSGNFNTTKELLEDGVKKGISFRGAYLRGANLEYADLAYTDLRGTYLRGVNLEGAKISYLIGNNKEIKTLQLGTYIVNFTEDTLAIGCQQHPIEDWKSFSDDVISSMDEGALEWWNTWKELIFKTLKTAILLQNTTYQKD